mgnify:CR=1 FL=1
MLWVQTNKPIRCFNCSFILERTVMRKDQLELRLLGVLPKGIAALELLQCPDCEIEVWAINVSLRLSLHLLLTGVGVNLKLIVIAK